MHQNNQVMLPDMSKEKLRLFNTIFRYFGPSAEDSTECARYEGLLLGKTKIALLSSFKMLGMQICGGAIISTITAAKVNDLDIYLKDLGKLREVQVLLEEYGFKLVYASTTSFTYKRKSSNRVYTVQLIKRFYGGPSEIFKTFDFTVTQCAYDFDSGFVFGQRTLQDIAARILVYSGGSSYPICAMYRTKKYMQRGYYLPGSTIMHMALGIVQLNIVNYAQLKEQLLGIDTMMLQGLLNSEKYADDLPVNYGEFLADAFSHLDSNPEENE